MSPTVRYQTIGPRDFDVATTSPSSWRPSEPDNVESDIYLAGVSGLLSTPVDYHSVCGPKDVGPG